MKTHILICLFVLVQCFSSVSGQVTFDKGYIIDNSGVKIECLIRNFDWWANPKTIQYRLSKEEPVVSTSIDSIREFGVGNYSRFVRATVMIDRSPIVRVATMADIDRSPIDIESHATIKAPLWSEETLLLKELICGKACLWVYAEERPWYFYSIDGSHPEQLVYKEYRVNNTIYENAKFRQQLYNNLRNENTKGVNLTNLEYKEKALVKYFERYNADKENIQPGIKKTKREVFNLKLTGSLNNTRLKITNMKTTYGEYDFGNKTHWGGGLEMEYFFPFNRNRVSVIFAPTFDHYKNSKIIYASPRNMDLISVRFPFGIRYGLYLNNDMKFFGNFYYNPFFCINKGNGFIPAAHYYPLEITEDYNWILGGGFAYKKWQIELKYHTDRDLFNKYLFWNVDYTQVSLSVSYKLFCVRR